jgi:hypothetical protein
VSTVLVPSILGDKVLVLAILGDKILDLAIRSEFIIKLKNINKNRMVIVSRVFISEDFLVNPLLSQMQLLQQSNYRRKAVANWSMPMFRPTPPQIFLKLSRVKTAPASTSFTSQKKK